MIGERWRPPGPGAPYPDEFLTLREHAPEPQRSTSSVRVPAHHSEAKEMALRLCPEADMSLTISDAALTDCDRNAWHDFDLALSSHRGACHAAVAESPVEFVRYVVWKMPDDTEHRARITAAMEPIVRAIDAHRRR